jgi:hypothetical protein
MGVRLNNFKGIAKGVWASPLNPMECESDGLCVKELREAVLRLAGISQDFLHVSKEGDI